VPSSWLECCKERSYELLRPIADVNVKEGLEGDWCPLPTLQVVAQIRALAVEDDTLPANLPAATTLRAASWIDVEHNAGWHRKVAVALRNSGHHSQAIAYFECALVLDEDLVEARRGLAVKYEEQGHFN
jgi:hypothetical protein